VEELELGTDIGELAEAAPDALAEAVAVAEPVLDAPAQPARGVLDAVIQLLTLLLESGFVTREEVTNRLCHFLSSEVGESR
jgi:hypothetical protein